MKIVFATHNLNKLKEVKSLIPQSISLLSLEEIGCTDDIIEDALTIKGNAILKAEYIKKTYGFDCFADDTGLEVEALNGEPGVLSARYAGTHKSAQDNMSKLLENLQEHPNRKAQFKTVMAYAQGNKIHTFEGICKGEITYQKKGHEGFGYDPIFKPENHNETFAQMPLVLKNKLSHRALALKKLVHFLQINANNLD